MRLFCCVTACLLASASQVARADDPPVSPPATLLAGPAAGEMQRSDPTLLTLDFDGHLEHIVGEPGFEAMRRIGLTPEQQAALSKVDQERTTQFNAIATRALPQLIALEGIEARLQGSFRTRSGALIDLARAYLATRKIVHRASALDALAATGAFDASQLATARSMVAAYEKALRLEIANATPNLSEQELERRAHIAMLLELLQEGIATRAKAGEEEFDRLSEAVQLTPAQAERVKSIFAPIAVQEYLGNRVGLLDRVHAMLEASRELTAVQRERAWKYIKDEARAVEPSPSGNPARGLPTLRD